MQNGYGRLKGRLLEVFRAVMKTGQVTRAAELLHTSQPTVSRDLARLEQVLGLSLFRREQGRLHPTDEALSLHEEVERSYVGLQRIEALAQRLRQGEAQPLRLASPPAYAQGVLPGALARWRRSHPLASCHLRCLESPQLEEAMAEQAFDFGLSEARWAPGGCERELLFQGEEWALLPPGHRLAGKSRLDLKDFQGEAFVSFGLADPYRHELDGRFREAQVSRQEGLEADTAAAVVAMVVQGLGVSILNPLSALMAQSQGAELRPLAFEVRFELALLRPKWRTPSPVHEAFLPALRDTLHAQAQALDRLRAAHA